MRKYDVSSLKVVAASGSALPGDLATKWMDEFGDTLYNLYGSTEVAWATIATPGRHARGAGHRGQAAARHRRQALRRERRGGAQGETGRIFVGNEMLFEGYTGGGSKDVIDGLMATGDVGRLDDAGRLFVEGRDDEMIVSGGENLFPQGGRGPAGRATTPWPRWPRSAWTTRSSASACARSWCRAAARAPARTS